MFMAVTLLLASPPLDGSMACPGRTLIKGPLVGKGLAQMTLGVVDDADNSTHRVFVTERTRIFRNRRPAMFLQLQAGDHIRARGCDDEGLFTARVVRARDATDQ